MDVSHLYSRPNAGFAPASLWKQKPEYYVLWFP